MRDQRLEHNPTQDLESGRESDKKDFKQGLREREIPERGDRDRDRERKSHGDRAREFGTRRDGKIDAHGSRSV